MSKTDYKVSAFRNKYEQDLRKLVTQGCCVASCTNDGMTDQEEIEMNELTKIVVSLVDRARRQPKKSSPALEGGNVVSMGRP